MGFRGFNRGLGSRVWGLGFRVRVQGFRIRVFGLRVKGLVLGFRV